MNQSIEFSDRESWDEELDSVIFPAMVEGMQIQCTISKRVLNKFYGTCSTEASCLQIFKDHRWDIEDLAEKLIIDDKISDYGYLIVSNER